MNTILAGLLLLMVTLVSIARADTSNPYLIKTLDVMMAAAFPEAEPGAVILVAQKGEVIYHKGFGMADLELQVPMQKDMVFEIGSITKQFTAVAILMLLEEGKLSLDDDITKYLPDYPTHGHTITIHHLLTHTSGIKSYTSMPSWMPEWRRDFTPLELIDFFKNEPMDFEPGEQYAYNNSGYFILGYIIEKASGMTYEDFIEQRIFQPLGMRDSRYGHKGEIVPRRTTGYTKSRDDGSYIHAEYLSMTQPYAAGSLMSTVSDLYIWNQAVHAHKLVSGETLKKALTDHTLNNGNRIGYGYGWSFDTIAGSPTIEHSGGIFGYVSNGIYMPNEDLYLVMLSNCEANNLSALSNRMLAASMGKPYPVDLPRVDLTEAQLKSYIGVYAFEDGASRTFTFEDGHLWSQRSGSNKFKVEPIAEDHFVYAGSLSSIRFVRDGEVMKAIFTNGNTSTPGRRSDTAVPAGRQEISLTPEQLAPLLGVYEIQPGFDIAFTLKDGQLMTQATGQPAFEVYAESPTRFFLKVVEAQIEFIPDDTGAYTSIMLYQGGQSISGKRKQ